MSSINALVGSAQGEGKWREREKLERERERERERRDGWGREKSSFGQSSELLLAVHRRIAVIID